MGKKKRGHPDIEEILARPWCYYCERDFDDLKILINHQKAKHFKCERCGRRLNTAGGEQLQFLRKGAANSARQGLSVHMTQVHKETLTTIDNALPNRSGLEVEIFGMEGIPEDIVQSHNQRVLQQFAQAEAERRAATGNPGPGGSAAGGPQKKPKFEPPSDLKKRLAEHKAKKAVEEAAGISSGNDTPGGAGESIQSPGNYVSHNFYYDWLRLIQPQPGSGSPGYPQQQNPFGPPPSNATYSSFPQTYGQPPPVFQPQPPPFQQQPPPFSQPPQQSFSPPGPQFPISQGFGPPQQFQGLGGPGPSPGPGPGPGFPPPQYQGNPSQFQNGPPQGPPQFQNGPPPQFQHGPPTQFQNGPPPQFQNGPPPQFQNGPPPHFNNGLPQQFQGGPLQMHNGPPQSFGAGSPPPFQHSQFQPPRTNTPPQHSGISQRPASLPPAPGLPQRPSFGAPPVNHHQMQQMHQGQLPGPPSNHAYHLQQNSNGGPGAPPSFKGSPSNSLPEPLKKLSDNATSLDDLVSGAAKDADKAASGPEVKPQEEPEAAGGTKEEKKGKKEKDKSMKLIYSDNEVSPEEKMAQMPRYAFAPSQ